MKAVENKKELRKTWLGFTVIFGVIGLVLWYRGRVYYPWFLGVSSFFAVFAVVAPMALLPFYRVWMKFAGALAWFNTRLLLFITFYLVMTPIGLCMRLFGKDPMERKLEPTASTYWKKREKQDDLSRYDKQF